MVYAGLPRISTTTTVRRLSLSGHCWRSKNEIASDLFLLEPKHGKRSIRGQVRTTVDVLEADTGIPSDSLPATMDDRVGWRKKAMGGRLIEVDRIVVAVAWLRCEPRAFRTRGRHLKHLTVESVTWCCALGIVARHASRTKGSIWALV